MPKTGLEPVRYCYRGILSPVRLPIPPLRQIVSFGLLIKKPEIVWRRHPDLNWGIKVLQTLALPLGYGAVCLLIKMRHILFICRLVCLYIPRVYARDIRRMWSGRRDLNPRLRPWQGRTLPLSHSRTIRGLVLATRKGLEPSTSSVTG